MPRISYLVTVHNETETLEKLLSVLDAYLRGSTNEVVILDDFSDNPKTGEIIKAFLAQHPKESVKYVVHALDCNYGAHKNFGIENCSGDFIFQIDGDEMPPDYLLGDNIQALLDANPSSEAYAIPRINAWHGLTEENAKPWGWSLDISPTYNRLRAAWPDYQWRLFKRDYPRIQFKKRLHERIDGFKAYSILPAHEDFAIYHDKTIETQIATNLRYNKDFTTNENRGISDEQTHG